MHSRPYRGPQSEIIRREPLFLIGGSGALRATAFDTRKGAPRRWLGFGGDALGVKSAVFLIGTRSSERRNADARTRQDTV